MCKCTPEIRTPFCGKLNCQWPKPEGTRAMSKFKEERDAACVNYLQGGDVKLRLDIAFEAGWDKCLESSVVRGLVESLKLYHHIMITNEGRDAESALKAYSEALAEIRGER